MQAFLDNLGLVFFTTMFDSALELIDQAASNSLLVFCCCNLIIVMILVGSRPRSRIEQGRGSSTLTNTSANVTQGTNSMLSVDANKMLVDVKEESNAQEAAAVKEEETRNEDSNKEDDEFRKRVEVFIDEVNKGWKAESLRKSPLI